MTTYHDEEDLPRERLFGAFLVALGTAFTTWRAERARRLAQRRAIILMTEMPDWQLRDIGLNRGDVDRLVAEHRIVLDRAAAYQSC
ncbi:hypothetical protein [Pelagibacterium limicola]|uniref:hypothetical protein n=1 Tax=Pelagibacterium limicola TaxID=2791022 RepID=UPI0018AFD744|nr:hypothetical protein [Pelagibacterium limicola]